MRRLSSRLLSARDVGGMDAASVQVLAPQDAGDLPSGGGSRAGLPRCMPIGGPLLYASSEPHYGGMDAAVTWRHKGHGCPTAARGTDAPHLSAGCRRAAKPVLRAEGECGAIESWFTEGWTRDHGSLAKRRLWCGAEWCGLERYSADCVALE